MTIKSGHEGVELRLDSRVQLDNTDFAGSDVLVRLGENRFSGSGRDKFGALLAKGDAAHLEDREPGRENDWLGGRLPFQNPVGIREGN